MKLFSILLVPLLSILVLTGCGTPESLQPDVNGSNSENDTELDRDNNFLVEIEITDHGTITVELYPDQAPLTVENFMNLVNDGFYDSLTFHRIIDGFMMQGGDPLGNGTGGSDETIKGEFSSNGIDNPLSHTRGAISMARSQDMDSASSQFFIVHQNSTQLDDSYAVFGYVIDGMEIVDEICENIVVQDNNGTVASDDQPEITSIKQVE